MLCNSTTPWQAWRNKVNYKLGIIGAGKIGEALLAGAFAKNLFAPSEVILSVRSESHRLDLEHRYEVAATLDNRQVAANADIILLAVKPKALVDIINTIADCIPQGSLVISAVAGVSLDVLESRVPQFVGVIRAMPNLAVSVGEGMTVFACGKNASLQQIKKAEDLFGSVGRVLQLDEQHMDAVTGLSGSGPAYIYIVIESLADGGVKMGLPREAAIQMAAQTVLGAARTVLVTGEHPAKLKDQVTTPAGVTIDGIMELEEGGLRVTLIKAVVKATERARQLLHK
ncbi:MAG: pyrroline-5-carboxylate reductase [Candidatus Melainabacteria bacterium HGW-Melainabacteria-1]|nr:MAG: pyrroline-5-carboxylate reductase [Candidatus Melainabacteria bacterium HGW-Melainabacteria-1]